MSSQMNFVASLILIQSNLYKFGGPILIIVGTVSCVLSLAVFTKKNLRQNPCSIYFIAYNVSNFLLIYTSIILTTLANGYNINPTSYNLSFCRFRFYAMLLFDVLSPCYLILASVDRILLTSRNALTRQRSTRRLAYVCVVSVTLFWLLVHAHALVLTNILQLAPGFNFCYFQSGLHVTIMGYYSIIVKGILIPLLMLVLGLWTVKNIRGVGRIAPAPAVTGTGTTAGVPAAGGVRAAHSKDRQLLRILLIDISIYLIFSLMVSVVLLFQQFVHVSPADFVQTEIQVFLLTVGVFSSFIPLCVSCYTNLLVSKTFRSEAKDILKCK